MSTLDGIKYVNVRIILNFLSHDLFHKISMMKSQKSQIRYLPSIPIFLEIYREILSFFEEPMDTHSHLMC